MDESEKGRRPIRVLSIAVMATTTLLAAAGTAGAEDSSAGEKLFNACKVCHEIGEGAKHKVGPHLDGLIGRTAGALPDFKYTSAMREAGKGGLVWDAATIDSYITKPRDFVPGNRMSFRGMADAAQRKTLIAWLAEKGGAAPAADPNAVAAATDGQARSFADAVLALEGDREYGEYLSGDCVTCHQVSGQSDGIPSIVGLPRDYFVEALYEYKSNVRSNEVMKLRVQNLTNEELAALAAYFSSLEPQ